MSVFLENRYIYGELLSKNEKITVHRGIDIVQNKDVVIKTETFENNPSGKCEFEYNILNTLSPHPSIMTVLTLLKEKNAVHMISNYEGSLHIGTYINRFGSLDEEESRTIFQHICLGVQHLHKSNVVHADIKPQNIVLSHERRPIICDFGSSFLCEKGRKNKPSTVSIPYSAPEIIGQVSNGKALDIWSLGVLLYSLLTGSTPFTIDDWKKNKFFEWSSTLIFSPPLSYLIRRMLSIEPNKRFSIEDVLESVWFVPHGSPNLRRTSINQKNFLNVKKTQSFESSNRNHSILARFLLQRKRSSPDNLRAERTFSQ